MRRFELCCEKEGVQDPKDLKEFRSFCWMLTAEQSESVQTWEAAAVRSSKERQAQNKAKVLKDIEQELNSENEKKDISCYFEWIANCFSSTLERCQGGEEAIIVQQD